MNYLTNIPDPDLTEVYIDCKNLVSRIVIATNRTCAPTSVEFQALLQANNNDKINRNRT